MHPNLTGLVLAGGKSTRMGRDKATLSLDGRTLLEHALEVLRQVTGDVAILGSKQLYGGYGVPVIEDIYLGCGPLGGIHAALTNTKTDFNLIIAVDTPFLSPDFLSYMAKRAVEVRAVVTTPEIAGYRQPLCSVYAREFLAIAERALNGTEKHPPRRHGDTEGIGSSEHRVIGSSGKQGSPLINTNDTDQVRSSEGKKSKDFKIVPLFPEPGTLVINEAEMARFAFTAEMFENLNTPEDVARARERTAKP